MYIINIIYAYYVYHKLYMYIMFIIHIFYVYTVCILCINILCIYIYIYMRMLHACIYIIYQMYYIYIYIRMVLTSKFPKEIIKPLMPNPSRMTWENTMAKHVRPSYFPTLFSSTCYILLSTLIGLELHPLALNIALGCKPVSGRLNKLK